MQNTSAKTQTNYQITSNRSISNYTCKTFTLKVKQGKKEKIKQCLKPQRVRGKNRDKWGWQDTVSTSNVIVPPRIPSKGVITPEGAGLPKGISRYDQLFLKCLLHGVRIKGKT